MKGIKLNITVKYTVGVTMKVTDEQYDSLEYMGRRYPFGYNHDIMDSKCWEGYDFLAENIREKDACEWEYEINDLEEINDDEQN